MKYHNLIDKDFILKQIVTNMELLDIRPSDLEDKSKEQIIDMIVGEYYAKLSKIVGKLASEMLLRAQWGHESPEWYDHRHHLLNPEKNFTDFWTISADNVIRHLPVDGNLLDLCSGDGFYDRYYYSRRAKEVVCVELNSEAYNCAVRNHSADNIMYIQDNVLLFNPVINYFDVVLIRGAIEHFSEADQQLIFYKAKKALKMGGWFCGDTVANANQEGVLLPSHENEWADEEEMSLSLSKVFKHVETSTLISRERVTLLWACKKTD